MWLIEGQIASRGCSLGERSLPFEQGKARCARDRRSIPTLIFIFSLGSLSPPDRTQEPLVIVCHCRAATDREIRRAVREGAATLREVGSRCGAASGCGGCAEVVIEIIAAELGGAPRALDYDPPSTSL